jgi:hypothetical protein
MLKTLCAATGEGLEERRIAVEHSELPRVWNSSSLDIDNATRNSYPAVVLKHELLCSFHFSELHDLIFSLVC